MKKKSMKIFRCCIALSLALGAGYYFKVYKSEKVISIEANYKHYDSEKELSNAADIILYGSPVDKFEDREHVNKYIGNDISDFYTLTKFKINKVLENSTALNLKTSEVFDVIEPIGVVQTSTGKEILKFAFYDAMEHNEKYIVYLKSNGIGGYSVLNMNNGKFNVSKNDSNGDKTHENFKNDILKKYPSEIK